MEYFAITDIGNVREQNEDCFFCKDNLFIVADGMGGHAAGEVASKTAVETFVENFFLDNKIKKINIDDIEKPDTKKNENLKNITSENLKKLLQNLMLSSISKTNKKVYELSLKNPEYNGMGTTFTACYIINNLAGVVHVGDSRVYLKNDKSFRLLTQDHTVVWQMYKKGIISYEETFSHPFRNYLENVLGVYQKLKPDFFTFKVSSGDILILCTDGLNSMVKDEKINEIIESNLKIKNKNNKNLKNDKNELKGELQGEFKGELKYELKDKLKYEPKKDYFENIPVKIGNNLVSEAKKNGGLDNITIIVIAI